MTSLSVSRYDFNIHDDEMKQMEQKFMEDASKIGRD